MRTLTLPPGFRMRIQEQLGNESEQFFSSLLETPPVSVRLHPKKGKISSFTGVKVPWAKHGYYLDQRPQFQMDPHWHAGAFYVQEASSMILEFILEEIDLPERPAIWIDLCAAPGGKTGILASAMRKGDILLANEVVPARRKILNENLVKLGNCDVYIGGIHPKNFNKPIADVMLIDAPCSGEGMMRKDPEAVAQWSEKLVANCALVQQEILENATQSLLPDGWLIYSTCSYSPEENIKNVKRLVEQYGFESIPINFPIEWNIDSVGNDGIHGFQLWPHRVRGEGLFVSLLRRKPFPFKEVKVKKISTKPASEAWISDVNFKQFSHKGDTIIVHESGIGNASLLLELFKEIQPVSVIGTVKGKDFIPSHFLAMSDKVPYGTPNVALTYDQALDYLEKAHLHIPPVEFRNWGLVSYEHVHLGWIKSTQQGIKNHYPMDWRLRQRIHS